MSWATERRVGKVIENPDSPINPKRQVFDTCIVPGMAYYGMETMTVTIRSINKRRTTQTAIERIMLGKSLKDHIRNTDKKKEPN